jgi:hypothetical protein
MPWVADNGVTMDLQLRDKLAIVTGSSKGIGHAIATAWRTRARTCGERPVRGSSPTT